MTSLMGQTTNPDAWTWTECNNNQLVELNTLWITMVSDFKNSLNVIDEDW